MSENTFRALAQHETSMSRIMENRTKVSMDNIIQTYPGGVTVTEFDFMSMTTNGTTNTFPVVAFMEDPTRFFFGGQVLMKICQAWVDAYEGDVDAASTDLRNSGGVRMVFTRTRTRNGNNVTTVTII